MIRGRAGRAALLAVLIALPRPSGATPPEAGFLDLLQPGGRPSRGLGGDPFLSTFEDEVGWWAEGDPAMRRTATLEAVRGEPVPLSWTDGRGGIAHDALTFSASAEPRALGRPFLLAGRVSRPRWSSAWSPSPADGSMRLDGSRTRAGLALRAPAIASAVTVQATGAILFGGEEGTLRSARAGLRARPRKWLDLQCDVGTVETPATLHSSLLDVAWSASLNASARPLAFEARLVPVSWFRMEGAHRLVRYRPAEGVSATPSYQLSPSGTRGHDEASIVLGGARSRRLLARWTRRRWDFEGEGRYGGERFALVNYARADLTSILFAADARSRGGTRGVLELEEVRAEGSARARVETWPFTETMVDLLGLRRIGRADVSARWARWHAGIESPLSRRLSGSFGLSWYDVRPRATIEHWSPAFLVFGETDRQGNDLSVSRVRLAALSLGSEWCAGAFTIRGSARQLVAGVVDRAPGGSEGGGDPGAQDDAGGAGVGREGDASPRRWPGGGEFAVSIERGF